MEIIKYYVLLILTPLMLYAGWIQFKACVKVEPMNPKGIIHGAITMLHAWLLWYIFIEHYYIVQDF